MIQQLSVAFEKPPLLEIGTDSIKAWEKLVELGYLLPIYAPAKWPDEEFLAVELCEGGVWENHVQLRPTMRAERWRDSIETVAAIALMDRQPYRVLAKTARFGIDYGTAEMRALAHASASIRAQIEMTHERLRQFADRWGKL